MQWCMTKSTTNKKKIRNAMLSKYQSYTYKHTGKRRKWDTVKQTEKAMNTMKNHKWFS